MSIIHKIPQILEANNDRVVMIWRQIVEYALYYYRALVNSEQYTAINLLKVGKIVRLKKCVCFMANKQILKGFTAKKQMPTLMIKNTNCINIKGMQKAIQLISKYIEKLFQLSKKLNGVTNKQFQIQFERIGILFISSSKILFTNQQVHWFYQLHFRTRKLSETLTFHNHQNSSLLSLKFSSHSYKNYHSQPHQIVKPNKIPPLRKAIRQQTLPSICKKMNSNQNRFKNISTLEGKKSFRNSLKLDRSSRKLRTQSTSTLYIKQNNNTEIKQNNNEKQLKKYIKPKHLQKLMRSNQTHHKLIINQRQKTNYQKLISEYCYKIFDQEKVKLKINSTLYNASIFIQDLKLAFNQVSKPNLKQIFQKQSFKLYKISKVKLQKKFIPMSRKHFKIYLDAFNFLMSQRKKFCQLSRVKNGFEDQIQLIQNILCQFQRILNQNQISQQNTFQAFQNLKQKKNHKNQFQDYKKSLQKSKLKLSIQISNLLRQTLYFLPKYIQQYLFKKGKCLIEVKFKELYVEGLNKKQLIISIRKILEHIIQVINKISPKQISIQTHEQKNIDLFLNQCQQKFNLCIQSWNQILKGVFEGYILVKSPRLYLNYQSASTYAQKLQQYYNNINNLPNILHFQNFMTNIQENKKQILLKVEQILISLYQSYNNLFIKKSNTIMKIVNQYTPSNPNETIFIGKEKRQQYSNRLSHLYLQVLQLSNLLENRRRFYGQQNQLYPSIYKLKLKIKLFQQNSIKKLKQHLSKQGQHSKILSQKNKINKKKLTQLNNLLKKIVKTIKNKNDIAQKQEQILQLIKMHKEYLVDDEIITSQMKSVGMSCWDDDEYFTNYANYFTLSFEFTKKPLYKTINNNVITSITIQQYKLYLKELYIFNNKIKDNPLSEIFIAHYESLNNSLLLIQPVLYKLYDHQQIKQLKNLGYEITYPTTLRIKDLIHKSESIDLNSLNKVRNIYKQSKKKQFQRIKRQKIMKLDLKTKNNPKNKLIYIQNINEIKQQLDQTYDPMYQAIIFHLDFLNQSYKQLCFLSLSITSDYMSKQSKLNYENMVLIYTQILNKFTGKLKQLSNQLNQKLKQSINYFKINYLQQLIKQKIKSFPRLGLMKDKDIIECLNWEDNASISKNIKNLYHDVTKIHFNLLNHISHLQISNDMIEVIPPISINHLLLNKGEPLKSFHLQIIQNLQKTIHSSLHRNCQIKLLILFIYYTEQVQCSIITNTPLTQFFKRLNLLQLQIINDLRYDIYNNKSEQISQIILFKDHLKSLGEFPKEVDYSWVSTIKVKQRSNKIIIQQFDYQFSYGFQPKQKQVVHPKNRLINNIQYGANPSHFITSAYIYGMPYQNFLYLSEYVLLKDISSFISFIQKNHYFIQIQASAKQVINKIHSQVLKFNFKQMIKNRIKIPIFMKYNQYKQIPPVFNQKYRFYHLLQPNIQLLTISVFGKYNLVRNKIQLKEQFCGKQLSPLIYKLLQAIQQQNEDFNIQIEKELIKEIQCIIYPKIELLQFCYKINQALTKIKKLNYSQILYNLFEVNILIAKQLKYQSLNQIQLKLSQHIKGRQKLKYKFMLIYGKVSSKSYIIKKIVSKYGYSKMYGTVFCQLLDLKSFESLKQSKYIIEAQNTNQLNPAMVSQLIMIYIPQKSQNQIKQIVKKLILQVHTQKIELYQNKNDECDSTIQTLKQTEILQKYQYILSLIHKNYHYNSGILGKFQIVQIVIQLYRSRLYLTSLNDCSMNNLLKLWVLCVFDICYYGIQCNQRQKFTQSLRKLKIHLIKVQQLQNHIFYDGFIYKYDAIIKKLKYSTQNTLINYSVEKTLIKQLVESNINCNIIMQNIGQSKLFRQQIINVLPISTIYLSFQIQCLNLLKIKPNKYLGNKLVFYIEDIHMATKDDLTQIKILKQNQSLPVNKLFIITGKQSNPYTRLLRHFFTIYLGQTTFQSLFKKMIKFGIGQDIIHYIKLLISSQKLGDYKTQLQFLQKMYARLPNQFFIKYFVSQLIIMHLDLKQLTIDQHKKWCEYLLKEYQISVPINYYLKIDKHSKMQVKQSQVNKQIQNYLQNNKDLKQIKDFLSLDFISNGLKYGLYNRNYVIIDDVNIFPKLIAKILGVPIFKVQLNYFIRDLLDIIQNFGDYKEAKVIIKGQILYNKKFQIFFKHIILKLDLFNTFQQLRQYWTFQTNKKQFVETVDNIGNMLRNQFQNILYNKIKFIFVFNDLPKCDIDQFLSCVKHQIVFINTLSNQSIKRNIAKGLIDIKSNLLPSYLINQLYQSIQIVSSSSSISYDKLIKGINFLLKQATISNKIENTCKKKLTFQRMIQQINIQKIKLQKLNQRLNEQKQVCEILRKKINFFPKNNYLHVYSHNKEIAKCRDQFNSHKNFYKFKMFDYDLIPQIKNKIQNQLNNWKLFNESNRLLAFKQNLGGQSFQFFEPLSQNQVQQLLKKLQNLKQTQSPLIILYSSYVKHIIQIGITIRKQKKQYWVDLYRVQAYVIQYNYTMDLLILYKQQIAQLEKLRNQIQQKLEFYQIVSQGYKVISIESQQDIQNKFFLQVYSLIKVLFIDWVVDNQKIQRQIGQIFQIKKKKSKIKLFNRNYIDYSEGYLSKLQCLNKSNYFVVYDPYTIFNSLCHNYGYQLVKLNNNNQLKKYASKIIIYWTWIDSLEDVQTVQQKIAKYVSQLQNKYRDINSDKFIEKICIIIKQLYYYQFFPQNWMILNFQLTFTTFNECINHYQKQKTIDQDLQNYSLVEKLSKDAINQIDINEKDILLRLYDYKLHLKTFLSNNIKYIKLYVDHKQNKYNRQETLQIFNRLKDRLTTHKHQYNLLIKFKNEINFKTCKIQDWLDNLKCSYLPYSQEILIRFLSINNILFVVYKSFNPKILKDLLNLQQYGYFKCQFYFQELKFKEVYLRDFGGKGFVVDQRDCVNRVKIIFLHQANFQVTNFIFKVMHTGIVMWI